MIRAKTTSVEVQRLPYIPCYSVTLVIYDEEEGEEVTWDVTLVPTTMPGWTYDAFVFDRDGDGYPTYVHAVSIPGIENPTPEDYARAAVREVLS